MNKIQKLKKDSGMVMLEGMLSLIVTMFTMYLLLSMGFLLYEKYTIQVIADDTASKLAQSYRSDRADFVSGKVENGQLLKTSPYRYVKDSNSANNFMTQKKEDAKKYAITRLDLMSMALSENGGKQAPDVSINVKSDNIGRNHVEVKIKTRNRVLLGEFLSLMGMDAVQEHTAAAAADCLDIIHYCDTVAFERRLCDMSLSNDTIESVKYWIGEFSKIF